MPNSLQDAIAGIVYRKILACPDRFPDELVHLVQIHYRSSWWKPYGEHMSKGMNCTVSEKFQHFVDALGRYADSLPEFLAEDRD